MKSTVYWVRVAETDSIAAINDKLERLIARSGVLAGCAGLGRTAIKLHFGEQGNTGFVRPEHVRVIADAIRRAGGTCFVGDTNTLYKGRRVYADDHLKLAAEHGFTPDSLGCPVEVPDERQSGMVADIPIRLRHIQTAHVAQPFAAAEALVSVAHFKGHIMTGFGGVLKNVGMGCAARRGKLAQHSDVAPFVHEQACVGCATCVGACPVDAIAMLNGKARIDNPRCIGCATCIAVCPVKAIDVPWALGGATIQEKMVEYACAALRGKQHAAFFNFAIKITKECDCLAQDDPRLCPDVGIFAARDPVSADQAALDAVLQAAGRDLFKEAHPERDGREQLRYAAQLGLGQLEYELVEV